MRKQLFLTGLCAGCLALGAQAQVHSGGTSTDRDSSDAGSGLNQSQDSSQQPSTWDRIKGLAATGRTQHEVRASQLTSAEVKSSTGESIGTISELIVNPNSGKVDFAVISLSGSTGASGSTSSSGQTGTSSTASGTAGSSSYSSNGGKQVVVPFSLLHPANAGGASSTYSSSRSSANMGQMTFTFSGDVNKL